MQLETERLILLPLEYDDLESLIFDLPKFESKFKVKYDGEKIDGEIKDIFIRQLKKIKEDEKHYLFHTFIMMIRKSDRVIVGSCDYKDVDLNKKVTEIGYGLGKEYEGNGYMTESVRELIRYAFEEIKLDTVIAETLKDNYKSQNVLKRLDFSLDKEGEESFWWIKRK